MDGMLAYCSTCQDVRPHAMIDPGSCLCPCGQVQMMVRAMDVGPWAATTRAVA